MCDLWMVGGVRGGAVGGRVLVGAWVTFGLWAGGGRWDGVRGVAVGGVGVGVGAGFVVAFSSHCAWRSLWYAKNSSARSSQSASPRRARPRKGLSASLVGRGEESRSSHRVPFSPPRAVGCDGRPRRADMLSRRSPALSGGACRQRACRRARRGCRRACRRARRSRRARPSSPW